MAKKSKRTPETGQEAAGNNVKVSNTFSDGLIADLHELIAPKNSYSDALNMELITEGEDQYIFQNMVGDKFEVDFGTTSEIIEGAYRPYVPVAMSSRDDIAYILLGAFIGKRFVMGAIGTFPSPDWGRLNAGEIVPLENKYRHLHNYRSTSVGKYEEPFESTQFNFSANVHIDMVLQGDFDESLNIIFSDGINVMRIINSRFKRVGLGRDIQLADRLGNSDSNTYADDDWDRIALIQNASTPITVNGPTVKDNGYLRGGGYRYYFKYITQEGNATDVLYESGLIPIAAGGTGLSKEQLSTKSVSFELSGLNTAYSGVKVYFAHFDGAATAQAQFFELDTAFYYADGASAVTISHSGLEEVTVVDISEINTHFTSIDSVESIAAISDRLAIAGTSSTLSGEDAKILQEASLGITLTESSVVIDESYANPEAAAKQLGYWKGEVYEAAVVYMLTNKGLSPAFPVTGMDNFDGGQEHFGDNPANPGHVLYPQAEYDDIAVGGPNEGGFSANSLVNHKGVFRTSNKGDIYHYNNDTKTEYRTVVYLKADTSSLTANSDIRRLCSGFFIVRRKRIKNVLMQGITVPTLKVPSAFCTIPRAVNSYQFDVAAASRYLVKHCPVTNPTIGLNTGYESVAFYTKNNKGFSKKDDAVLFNTDFDTVFVPQPTQIIQTITYEKAWMVTGNISQVGADKDAQGNRVINTLYSETVDREGKRAGYSHTAFYSPEIDLNYELVKDAMSGINPHVSIQRMRNDSSPVYHTESRNKGLDYTSEPNSVLLNLEKISMDRAGWTDIAGDRVAATLIDNEVSSQSDGAFSAVTDRALGFLSGNTDTGDIGVKTTVGRAYVPYEIFYGKVMMKSYSKTEPGERRDVHDFNYSKSSFRPYSTIGNKYSAFLGMKIETTGVLTDSPMFRFKAKPVSRLDLVSPAPDYVGNFSPSKDALFVHSGHLTNIYRAGLGRWSQADIRLLYTENSNAVYHPCSDRVPLVTKTVDVFRGDGFISRFFKRTSYKMGVTTSLSATSKSAGAYGIGLISDHGNDGMDEDGALPVTEKRDEGRGLYDVGQILEMITYSNINADIRSTQEFSPEESAILGYDRDFYPNRKDLFGDPRPDSTEYNHGYTGDQPILVFSGLETSAPTYNTNFPNRVLVSEKNLAHNFFNSFRNLKGYNFRDYGIDLGPIIKIVAIKNLLLTVHRGGVLAIGVDDKTLMSDGSDIVVDTAKVLSPTALEVSRIYGSVHKESIVKTASTVVGVDYHRNAVWMFSGDKLVVVSETAVESLLMAYKYQIDNNTFVGAVTGIVCLPRVYSTFNHSNHAVTITYVAEEFDTGIQHQVGGLVFNVLSNTWVSRVSEGNKFSVTLSSNTFTVGVGDGNTLWRYGALRALDNPYVKLAGRFRGIEYGHEFEITLNDYPMLEKILDNIQMVTNKTLPVSIEYTTSGDTNDAAVNIWGDEPNPKTFVQEIITRNKSTRSNSRLRILDENAYYKNSTLYIEVGRVSALTRSRLGTKRIRDKTIRVRFRYEGNDRMFIQNVISVLSISYS